MKLPCCKMILLSKRALLISERFLRNLSSLSLIVKRSMSFIEVKENSDFPIENLPYGIFSTKSNVCT